MHVCILDHPRITSRERFNDIANAPPWSCLLSRYATAALLAEGHTATWLDAADEGLDFHETQTRVGEFSPDLLLVHAVYFWEHTPRLIELIAELKAMCPATHVCLFGFFPSLATERLLLLCPAVDSVCVGECEQTLAQLANALATGRDWRGVAGLAFERGGSVSFPTPRPPAEDPDRFAFPYYPPDQVVAPDDTAALLASRGCYNHCAFCPIPAFYNRGPLWRGRRPDRVIEEVRWLMAKGYRRFYFVDPNFVGPGETGRQRTMQLMAGLKPLGIRFGMETRPGDLTADLMAAMTGAGLESLLLGIESSSTGVLDRLARHTSAEESRRAIDLCREAGIEPEVGFLMHTPDGTLDDIAHNLDYLTHCRLLDRLDRTVNLLSHRQIVFRGTRGFENYRKTQRILKMDPMDFEARVAWVDPRAEWVADVTVPVCLDVLRAMADEGSPLYWKRAADNRLLVKRVNADLVAMFRGVLHRAGEAPLTPVAEAARQARQRVFYDLGPPG